MLLAAAFAVLALGWSGGAAWVVAGLAGLYLIPLDRLAHIDSWVATLVFTVPAFLAGTVFRLRRRDRRRSWPAAPRSSRRSASSSPSWRCVTSAPGSPPSCTTSSATRSA